jgi:adenine-specific DNA methylase
MAVNKPPRLLIEEWLPAAAIGVECMRERSTGQQPPDKRLHVWWARRPLTASRAAVLGSLLPADFPRDVFERLLGFGRPGHELVEVRQYLDGKPADVRVPTGFECPRAYMAQVAERDLSLAHSAATRVWGEEPVILDPMAGGGSIPFEAVRLGFAVRANEYNPVASCILEATVDYPFRANQDFLAKLSKVARVWEQRVCARLSPFFCERRHAAVRDYLYARTVPCPDTGYMTPLVPDWYLANPKRSSKPPVVAEPVVDRRAGRWSIRVREIGHGAGQLPRPPEPTYIGGKGISLFTGRQIPTDYIKAIAQQGKLESALYAIVLDTTKGKQFEAPLPEDFKALDAAGNELARLLPSWTKGNILPTEEFPEITSDLRPRAYGMPRWRDMFSPRQQLTLGVAVEELGGLRKELLREADSDRIIHILAFAIDKFANYSCMLGSWNAPRLVVRSVFDRHDFSFKPTFSEMAPCGSGEGLRWAVDNTLEAFTDMCSLPRAKGAIPAETTIGSASGLPHLSDKSITAVVVDPPYADNVQYSELADFFYVWLKRTQGYRRPEWFSTYLCDHDQEAVVCPVRHRQDDEPLKVAKARANDFYQKLMTDVFRECHRILRDDGVLTVMFTHKKQEAWEALFESLIRAGFMIEATWPVKTESEHSLHQAKKNAAQSTVILVSRKRPAGAGVGYFDARMQEEIRQAARKSAERLKNEGLNAVDQLVGSFGPAMEVYSRHDEVRTDTGDPVGVAKAIDEASDAVSRWRIEQLAARGLEGVQPEGQFYLLCWDVLGAAEFRFNEASLLGKAVGMDVDQLVAAGLVTKSGENIRILPARERRRERALEPDEVFETLYGTQTVPKKRTKKQVLKVHPNDPQFRTALDACHALALRHIEAKGGSGGIGSAKALTRQQGWTKDSPVAKLMAALVIAAPEAVKFEKGKKSAAATFPEFRAWHEMLKPLFEIEAPEWKEKQAPQGLFALEGGETDEDADEGGEE